MNFQHAALNYAERGFHVFPLRPRDKVPLSGSRGELDATTDAATIAEWWRRCPDANVAIVPGASGLFVLDVDPRNYGDESLSTLPPLPDTLTTCTGGGGAHYWFQRPVALARRRCKALRLPGCARSGLDVKGVCSGYVVAPPSVHPNGREYLWDAERGLDARAPAVAPGWLEELVLRSGDRAVKRAPHTVPVEASSFRLGVVFAAARMLGPQLAPGTFAVRCPNEQAHSGGTPFDSSTVIFAPARPGGRGVFYCAHTSACAGTFR